MSSNAAIGNEGCLPPVSVYPGAQVDAAVPGGEPSPAWVARHGLCEMRNLCTMGLTPRTLTGIIMRLLMNHFSDPAAIMTPNLRQYLFSPTQTDSKIRIEKAVTFNPAGAGLFPALIVKRMASESRRHSLGDRTDNPNTGTDDDALKGISHFSRFNTGVHRIFCIAEASAVSEDLAQEVFDFFSFLSPAIREHLPFHDFEVIGLGEDGALTETATQVGISVDVKYVYEYAWTLEALAPRIKVFKIQPTH